MTKEALKLALEALGWTDEWRPQGLKEEAITAIKEALAQPEQEPVAWGMEQSDGEILDVITPEEHARVEGGYTVPLYRHPQRTWVGLTDGEIEVIEALKAPPVHPDFIDCDDWMDFARAIETKLKEKNELR
jgi:hypothetical protein